MSISRRKAIIGTGLFGFTLATSAVHAYESPWPKKPLVPTDFNAQEFYTELEKNGTGVVIGENKNLPTVYMVFDTQCSWCLWQYKQYEPYLKYVNFVWCPVAVLNPRSELQGAHILAAKDRKAKFLEHEEHFRDADFKGLNVDKLPLPPMEMREALWTNTKIYRRAGGRDVPFGVIKLNGKFISLPEQKGEELKKILGLK